MQQHAPLGNGDKDYLWQARQRGDSLAQIADQLHCSVACVRKWWRRARDHGPAALHGQSRGRPPSGLGATFSREVVERALALKGQHPRWGGRRVWTELHTDPRFCDQHLPSPSLLHALFHAHGLTQPRRSPALTPPLPPPPTPMVGHVVWQLDAQEGVRLADDHRVTICNIRDPYGAVFIASQVVDVTTEYGYRKLTWHEAQAILRQAFSQWHTLPDVLQSDNDPAVWGAAPTPSPRS
ncbi:MAG: helix-turn-helix domain-containing protein [Anaerolineae bacterium]